MIIFANNVLNLVEIESRGILKAGLNLKVKKNIMLNNLLSIKLSISSGPEITRTLGAILDNLL